MSLLVNNPIIREVLDRDTGQFAHVSTFIGSDEPLVIQRRMEARVRNLAGDPKYLCALCFQPVYIAGYEGRRTYHFKHKVEDGSCAAITRGQLSQDEIRAIKYNGAKESQRHFNLKHQVADSLSTDPRFSDVKVEPVWKGAITSAWRKPDVTALWEGKRIAFEIQLSTTFLDVIVGRRQFYLDEGGLLFWIFGDFEAEGRRLTQDDVFFNNNANAFVVTDQTFGASKAKQSFHLEACWVRPKAGGGVSGLFRRHVTFSELTLDFAQQRAYYFDFDGEQAKLVTDAAEETSALREQFQAFWLKYVTDYTHTDAEWAALRKGFRMRGMQLPYYASEIPQPMLSNLYSAKLGYPVGRRMDKLVQVAHRAVSSGQRKWLSQFRRALEAYGTGYLLKEQDKSGKWTEAVRKYKHALAKQDPTYAQDSTWDWLVEFLFPEMCQVEAKGARLVRQTTN